MGDERWVMREEGVAMTQEIRPHYRLQAWKEATRYFRPSIVSRAS